MNLEQRLLEASAPGGDRETIRRIVSQRANDDPTLAATVQLSALPRTLDDEVVSVLWRVASDPRARALADSGQDGASAEPPSVATVFDGLGFVIQHSDGRWVMHDIAREALLEELREEALRPRFILAVQALHALFVERAGTARAARRSARRVGPIIHAGSPARFEQIMRSVDGRSLSPAIEAVDVAAHVTPTAGLEVFKTQARSEIEDENPLAVDGLIRAAERILTAGTESVGDFTKWEIQLVRVELLMLLGDLSQAEELVRSLTDDTIDEGIRDRALAHLFTCLSRQSREREALDVAQHRLAVSPDDNLSRRSQARLNIAEMQVAAGKLTACRSTCEELLSDAAAAQDGELESIAWSLAALTSTEMGLPDAPELLVNAFDRHRLSSALSRWAASTLATVAVHVARTSSPEVLTAVIAEAEALESLAADGPTSPEPKLARLNAAGRLLEAMQLVGDLGGLAPPSTLADWTLRQTVADLLLSTRRLDEAETAYTEIIAAPEGWIEPLRRAAALANRGLVRLQRSRLDEAEADLVRAYGMPLVSEHPLYGPLCAGALALAEARRGLIPEATRWLDVAFATETEALALHVMRLAWRAEVFELAGDLEGALSQRRISMAVAEKAGLLGDALEGAAAALRLAALLRRWPLACELNADVGRLLAEIEAIDQAERRPDLAVRAAGSTLAMLGLDPRRLSPIDALDDLTQAAAAQPANWWLTLNVAYGAIRLGAYQRAWEAFEHLGAGEPALKALPVLRRRHAESMFRAGEQLLENGQAHRALTAFEGAPLLHDGVLDPLLVASRSAFAYVALGEDALARSVIERYASEQLESPSERFITECLAGMVELIAGDPGAADAHFLHALGAISDDDAKSYWAMIRGVGALVLPEHIDRFASHFAGFRVHEQRGADMARFTPTINTPVPDGWFVKQSITLLASDRQANIIASSEPLDPPIDTERYAAAQGELLSKEFPGYIEHDAGWQTLDNGEQVIRRRFSWEPPDGVRVTQVQMYAAAGGTGYTATATTPTSEFDRHHLVIATVLQGLVFNPEKSRAGPASDRQRPE